MKIINYEKSIDKKRIVDDAYGVCNYAHFPVTYEDVYEHLFGNEELIVKLLIDDNLNVCGFGVFEIFEQLFKNKLISMLYLSGMVISPDYQGHNISSKIIQTTYSEHSTDLVTLRTQNIAMLKSLVNSFNSLLTIPDTYNKELLEYLKMVKPFINISDDYIIRECYDTQLYPNLKAINDIYNLELCTRDAVGVVVEPKKEKVLSIFK